MCSGRQQNITQHLRACCLQLGCYSAHAVSDAVHLLAVSRYCFAVAQTLAVMENLIFFSRTCGVQIPHGVVAVLQMPMIQKRCATLCPKTR